MDRLPLVVLAFLLALPSIMCARDWADTAAKVERSVVRLTDREIMVDALTGEPHHVTGVCTGFSINETYSYFFTAYHCLNNGTTTDLTIDGIPARLLYANQELDIAVITANLHKPAIHARAKALRKGEQIATLGHGYGLADTLFRAGYVANPSLDLSASREFGPEFVGHWLMFDTSYIAGMSGGPVFDLDGKVVGVVQRADGQSGFGVNMSTILGATAFYWK